MREQTEESRTIVARLRLSRHRPDLDVSEPQTRQSADPAALLVEPGGQSHAVAERKAQHLDRIVGPGRQHCAERGPQSRQRIESAQGREAEVVSALRIHRREHGTEDERIQGIVHEPESIRPALTVRFPPD